MISREIVLKSGIKTKNQDLPGIRKTGKKLKKTYNLFVTCFNEFLIYESTIFFRDFFSFEIAAKCLFCENK